MTTWIAQGQLALVNALIVFIVTFVPVVVWQYRRYGRPNAARLLGAFGLSSYTTALLTYTWLPLPDPATLDCAVAPDARVVPFAMVGDIARAVERFGLPEALWSFTVLQVVLNVVLFVPWGAVVRQFLHRGLLVTTLSGLGASVLIETAQLTGLFGLYPCAYRTFDVDDLITNTFGAFAGAVLAPAILAWMPRARELAVQRHVPRRVTMVRRWLGMAADAFAFFVLSSVLSVLTLTSALLLGFDTTGGIGSFGWVAFAITVGIPWIVCFVVPPWGGYAASGGQYMVWLTPMWRDAAGRRTHGTLAQRLVRAHIVPGPMLVTLVLDEWLDLDSWVSLGWVAVAGIAVVMVPFTRTFRSLSGVVSRCEMVDIRFVDDIPDEVVEPSALS
ncbi:MAG: VanZ family protein [Propionibacteriaceae bacterium]|nr:VanZ family protein [Propionibacteriaceae bacterium]